MERELAAAFSNGAKAVCIQGEQIDGQVRQQRWDVVRGWLELIKSHKLPAGMASHTATTHLAAEEQGMPTDFYHQTLYRPDNYVKEGLEDISPLELNEEEAAFVSAGRRLERSEEGLLRLCRTGRLIAVGRGKNGTVKPEIVMPV